MVISDLLFAAASGEIDTVRRAISSKQIDINVVDYEGRTALMFRRKDSFSSFSLLLSQEAKARVPNVVGSPRRRAMPRSSST